ncbi:MAG: hypothetical protein ACE5EL_02455 [Anaerolineae bacterium]
MFKPRGTSKLQVPAPWQSAVQQAIDDLVSRLGVPRSRVAVTHVAEGRWSAGEGRPADAPGAPRRGLSIWLVAEGRTYRYRTDSAAGGVAPEPDVT